MVSLRLPGLLVLYMVRDLEIVDLLSYLLLIGGSIPNVEPFFYEMFISNLAPNCEPSIEPNFYSSIV